MRISFTGIVAGIIALIALSIVGGSFYTVDQTERAVITRYGKVVGTAQPGLGFKLPMIDDANKISVKTTTWRWEKMEAYSFDQQPAHMHISVTLHASPEQVGQLYARFGTLDGYVKQRISPHVNQQVKVVFGQYTAVRAIQSRSKLNMDVKDAIVASIGNEDLVMIESVQIEDIAFSDVYVKSIEQRMLAEVDVQKSQQNAEKEKILAQIVVTQAKAKADSARMQGEAEAYAIEARAKALGQNPNLVALTQAEKWDGKLPGTMIPGGAVPMLGLK